jgi:hypothetical protein
MASTYVRGSRRKAPPSSAPTDTPQQTKLAALRSQGGSWQELLTGVPRQPVRATNPWEAYRKAFPELKLRPIPGDQLSLLVSGYPNPKLSLKYWKLTQQSFRDWKPEKVAEQLLELLKQHRETFMSSGWVRNAVAEIVLAYDVVAQGFVNSYWKEVRYVRAPSREAALDALSWLQGDHRNHWLSAVNKIKWFYKDNPKPKEPGYKFAARANVWYIETQASKCADCLNVDALEVLATEVSKHPAKPSGYVADCAAAVLFGSSLSTLIHLRAELKIRGRALIAMRSDD